MQKVDLLEGSIVRSLTSLALPIMATSLIQMAYNMTDMIWIGRVSANAVAAVGAAGMYLWLANGLAMIPRLGGQVKVAHELGAQNIERAASCGQAAFHLGALLVVLFTTGRRYRGSEGRFADRVHLLYPGGGICHGGQRIYRTKLRRGPDGAHP